MFILSGKEKDLYVFIQNLLSSRRFRQTLAILEEYYVNKASINSIEKHLKDAPLWARYCAAKCYTNLGKCTKSLELLYDIVPTTTINDLKLNSSISTSETQLSNEFIVINSRF